MNPLHWSSSTGLDLDGYRQWVADFALVCTHLIRSTSANASSSAASNAVFDRRWWVFTFWYSERVKWLEEVTRRLTWKWLAFFVSSHLKPFIQPPETELWILGNDNQREEILRGCPTVSKKIRGRIQQLTLFLATSTPVNQGPGARAPFSRHPLKVSPPSKPSKTTTPPSSPGSLSKGKWLSTPLSTAVEKSRVFA